VTSICGAEKHRWKDVHRAEALPLRNSATTRFMSRGTVTWPAAQDDGCDVGISESCLTSWMKSADNEDGTKPGTTTSDNAEVRDARSR
jgi:hypothetical protein